MLHCHHGFVNAFMASITHCSSSARHSPFPSWKGAISSLNLTRYHHPSIRLYLSRNQLLNLQLLLLSANNTSPAQFQQPILLPSALWITQ